MVNLIVGAALLFAGAYMALRFAGRPASPGLLIGGGLMSMVAAPVPYLSRQGWIPTVSGLFIATAVAGFVLFPGDHFAGPTARSTGSALHALSITFHRDLIEPPAADGGALVSVGTSLLLATGAGEFHWLHRLSSQESLTAMQLTIPDPANRAAYFADFDDPKKAPRLRLTDIVFDPAPTPETLYAAHQVWKSSGRCYAMQISAVALTWSADRVPEAASDWRSVYQSSPCTPADHLFDDSETGGRLAWAADGGLLLTLGDVGFAGLDGSPPFAQDDAVDYGKILRIDPATGLATVVSKGHRNPQGLTVDRLGRIWESEHGPQGGDELNLIEQDGNYGWPEVTYGTNYGTRTWPLNPDGHDHEGFREPALAFVPSIAASALIEIRGEEFLQWDSDLLLASLRAQSLYRIRLRGEQVIYVEPIAIGERIRDLAQTDEGRIFLWSDAGIVIEIRRSAADTAFELTCAGCHAPAVGTAAGPSLAGIIGRDIAAQPGFSYSAALVKLDDVWTETNLDAFLRDPSGFAPGTTMVIDGLDDSTRAEVIAYLKSTQD